MFINMRFNLTFQKYLDPEVLLCIFSPLGENRNIRMKRDEI